MPQPAHGSLTLAMIGKDRWITATLGRHKLDSRLSDGVTVRALGSRVTGDSSGSQQNVCAGSFFNFIRTLHLLLKLLAIITHWTCHVSESYSLKVRVN